jgi:hypothetical protein
MGRQQGAHGENARDAMGKENGGGTMKAEIIRDRGIDWLDKVFDSPWCDRVCLMIIGLAALYFVPIVVRIFVR